MPWRKGKETSSATHNNKIVVDVDMPNIIETTNLSLEASFLFEAWG